MCNLNSLLVSQLPRVVPRLSGQLGSFIACWPVGSLSAVSQYGQLVYWFVSRPATYFLFGCLNFKSGLRATKELFVVALGVGNLLGACCIFLHWTEVAAAVKSCLPSFRCFCFLRPSQL